MRTNGSLQDCEVDRKPAGANNQLDDLSKHEEASRMPIQLGLPLPQCIWHQACQHWQDPDALGGRALELPLSPMSLVPLRWEHVSASIAAATQSPGPDELFGILVQILLPIAEVLEAAQQVANMNIEAKCAWNRRCSFRWGRPWTSTWGAAAPPRGSDSIRTWSLSLRTQPWSDGRQHLTRHPTQHELHRWSGAAASHHRHSRDIEPTFKQTQIIYIYIYIYRFKDT